MSRKEVAVASKGVRPSPIVLRRPSESEKSESSLLKTPKGPRSEEETSDSQRSASSSSASRRPKPVQDDLTRRLQLLDAFREFGSEKKRSPSPNSGPGNSTFSSSSAVLLRKHPSAPSFIPNTKAKPTPGRKKSDRAIAIAEKPSDSADSDADDDSDSGSSISEASLAAWSKTLSLQSSRKPVQLRDEVKRLLIDPDIRLRFRTYLVNVHSEESLDLWVAVEDLRTAPKEMRGALCQRIYDKFVSRTSDTCVNLGTATIKDIELLMREDEYVPTIFDMAQLEAMDLLGQNWWAEFQSSPLYLSYMENNKEQEHSNSESSTQTEDSLQQSKKKKKKTNKKGMLGKSKSVSMVTSGASGPSSGPGSTPKKASKTLSKKSLVGDAESGSEALTKKR